MRIAKAPLLFCEPDDTVAKTTMVPFMFASVMPPRTAPVGEESLTGFTVHTRFPPASYTFRLGELETATSNWPVPIRSPVKTNEA